MRETEGLTARVSIQAVGRSVTSKDFVEYMRFHEHKVSIALSHTHIHTFSLSDFPTPFSLSPPPPSSQLYVDAYAPQSFCYPIRRRGHVPEGTLSIEMKGEIAPQGEAIRTGERENEGE